ncbi:MAG TPA: tetratricopeptide repeat-containing sensor histidine kinase [Puia sp.]|nr:tetratricopeptide repeat-containing sensor histidine kinase [Puia sp.]
MKKPPPTPLRRQYVCRILIYHLLFLTGMIIAGPHPSRAQANRPSILLEKLHAAKQDTDRVNLYYSLSRWYWNRNTDSALLMAQNSLDLAQKIHFEKGIALAYLTKGVSLVSKGMLPEALECHFQCLRLSEKLGLVGLSGNEYNNIGIVYADLEDYAKALYYYQRAYDMALKVNDEAGRLNLLINIGEIYKKRGQPDSAIASNYQGYLIAQKAKDSLLIAITLYNMGENYVTKKEYRKAKSNLYEALAIAEKLKDDEDVAYCHSTLALALYYTGQYDSSLFYAQKGLEESKRSGIVELIKTAYNVLYLTHQEFGDYKKALDYRNLEVALHDSLIAVEKEKSIRYIQSSYELEKKQQQIDLLNKDNIIKNEELAKIKWRRNILIAGSLLLLLLSLILFRNYSQKRALSERLEIQNKNISAQNQQLEELGQVKNRLFSIIAHDLRGPVNSIWSMMKIIQVKGISGAESGSLIGKAVDSLDLTAKLLDNLLYWAKSQMDGMQISPVSFDVQQTIDQNVTLSKARAAEKQVNITMDETTAPVMAYADQAMVDIITRNLIENAVKFSKAGNLVAVSAEKTTDHILIAVKDEGAGIPPEARSKIFNKFSSYTTFGTAKEKGSGLGLLLCKELVEKNNGTIWFESTPEKGSTFYFTLPLA